MKRNLYVIRHKESGKLLSRDSEISLCGKARFKETQSPKFFFDLDEAKQAKEALGLCYAGLTSDDLEIVNTHNENNREEWEAVA